MTQTKLKTPNECFFSCSIEIIYIYLRQLWEKNNPNELRVRGTNTTT